MVLSKEERCALLEKARAKKKENSEAKKLQVQEQEQGKEPEKPASKTKKAPKKTLELNTVDDIKKAEEEFEIKNEVIRIKAPKKKTIIKRVIEVEEPSSDEEIQEEIVKVPKRKTKIEPSMTAPNPQKKEVPNYMKDIFPS